MCDLYILLLFYLLLLSDFHKVAHHHIANEKSFTCESQMVVGEFEKSAVDIALCRTQSIVAILRFQTFQVYAFVGSHGSRNDVVVVSVIVNALAIRRQFATFDGVNIFFNVSNVPTACQ